VKVATFVNAIRDKYQAEFERRYREDIRGAHDTVKSIYNGAVTSHGRATKAFEDFQNREGPEYGTPDDAYGRFRDRLSKLEQERDATDADLKTKKQALTDIETQLTAVPSVVEAGSTRSLSDAWKLQKAKVDQLEETLAALSKRVTPAHRDYIRTKATLEAESQRLTKVPQWDETSRSTSRNQTWLDLEGRRRSLQVDVEGLKSRFSRLDETLKALNLELKAVPDKVRRAGELKATVDRAVAELASASAAFGAARTTKERFVDKTRSLFVPLSVPTPSEVADDDPVFPNTALFIGLAAVVGILLGLGVAFLREFASPSFTTPSQVATALPVPMLGSGRRTLDPAGSRRRGGSSSCGADRRGNRDRGLGLPAHRLFHAQHERVDASLGVRCDAARLRKELICTKLSTDSSARRSRTYPIRASFSERSSHGGPRAARPHGRGATRFRGVDRRSRSGEDDDHPCPVPQTRADDGDRGHHQQPIDGRATSLRRRP
jgi:predicted  nucleic acid-binding Zn-ribbon protein